MTKEDNNTSNLDAVSRGLAMIGGLGITIIMVALGIGVINGANASPQTSQTIGLLLVAGGGLLVVAIGAWLAAVRPFEHFDDINQPLEDEGHH